MQLPSEVKIIIDKLTAAGFEAYAVGGCVRDLLLKKSPRDWDVTTSALPADIQKLFPKHFYNNRFGTVTVLTASPESALKEVEVTTYRIDGGYSDQRHPDAVTFGSRLAEDLARRDFTINAMAARDEIVDPFAGQKDLASRLIRAVGDPAARFQEDALRLLRAIRFAAELNFTIEPVTLAAIKANQAAIAAVSLERIREEFTRIIASDEPAKGLLLLQESGLLTTVLPELQEGVGVTQNKHHIYTVFDHNVKSLQFAADYDYPFHVRLAALLHDVGKPRTRRFAPVQGGAPHEGDYTFYGHEIVGARLAEKLMKRLRFSVADTKRVTHLVRHHMFYYDIGKVTEAGMRRLLRRVGPANFDDLIKLRIAERKGSGVPKARPYRLRHLQFLAEKVLQQPLSVSQLAIRGTDLMAALKLPPGPIIGGVLNALLAEVLEDPSKNTRAYLLQRAQTLKDKDPAALKALGAEAVESASAQREATIRRKYYV